MRCRGRPAPIERAARTTVRIERSARFYVLRRELPQSAARVSAHGDLAAEGERWRRARCGRRSRTARGRTSSPGRRLGQQPHVLVGRGDQLGAVDRLQRRRPAADATGRATAGRAPSVVGNGRPSKRSIVSISRSSWWRSIVALELPHPGALPVALVPRRDGVARAGAAGRRAGARRSRRRAATRPSSACHSSGGRSSSATTMPTWLTGLLVTVRIATSASDRPAEQPDVAGRAPWRRRRRG